MYAKQLSFEEFIIAELLKWAPQNIDSGSRYQFKSPNAENSEKLFLKIKEVADGQFVEFTSKHHPEPIKLNFVQVNDVRIIPLLHSSSNNGFTENFISHLRDEVTKQQGALKSCCLLILHNSKLDTIVNSSRDLAQQGFIWNVEVFKDALSQLIDKQDEGRDISSVLLDYQFDAIKQDNATLFGFEELYKAIQDGDLKFDELYLLKDPLVHDFTNSPKQLRKRLDENRKLYKEIEYEVDNFPSQLEDRLKDKFGAKFIKAKFPKGKIESWKHFPFDDYRDEIKKNQKQTLELDKIEFDKQNIFPKKKGSSAAQQREWHVIIQLEPEADRLELDLVWNGGDLENSHLSQPNQLLPNGSGYNVVSKGNKTSRTKLSVPFNGAPLFFTIGTEKRDKSSDRYRIHFLVLVKEQFNIESFKDIFLLNPKKKLIRLLTNETNLAVNPNAFSTLELNTANQQIPWSDVKAIDFRALSEKSNDVEFAIVNGEDTLNFIVEGEVADSSLTVPLIFDKERNNSILDDAYFGIFNREKDRVGIDNKEVLLITDRLMLMRLEARFIDEEILAFNETDGTVLDIKEIKSTDDDLHNAYSELYAYCRTRNTLPSLLSWGPEFREIVGKLVNSYITLLENIELDNVLSPGIKDILNIGLVKKKDIELISPFHPIVLAYYLELTTQFQSDLEYAKENEEDASFKKLHKITIKRLNPRGLIPYFFNKNNDFSHVNASDHNSFWLEAVPHEKSHYEFVTKLVKEKINEFQTAFTDLFENHEQSKLILSSVNQGTCHELFLGIVAYFKDNLENSSFVHVNVYDRELEMNSFDVFAESTNSDTLKEFLGIASKIYKNSADSIIELLRTRLTYSKFKTSEVNKYEYAHIAFFYNDEKVDCIPVNMDSKPSGVAADGLLGGESSESQYGSYHTAFGLQNVDYSESSLLKTAKLFGSLIRPARSLNTPYSGKDAIALAVNESFKTLLDQTCESSIWTTIIDPKVTLEFFNSQDKVLIHYSDQYTSSAGFDAITVSRQKDLFVKVLELGKGTQISDFNAFNGDWLLKMLTAPETAKLGMEGEIGAYKLITSMLHSDRMTWIPLSVGELVRVSGNIGLKILDSELSAANAGHKGAMSDDVLMIGLKNQEMVILPVEVKTGSTPDYKKAKEQVINLKGHLVKQLGPRTLKGKLNRALFFKQILGQIDKYRLYKVFHEAYFDLEYSNKNEWSRGEYTIEDIDSLPDGIVVSHLSSDSVFDPDYKEDGNILFIDLPIALLPSLVSGQLKDFMGEEGLPKQLKAPLLGRDAIDAETSKSTSNVQQTQTSIDSTIDENNSSELHQLTPEKSATKDNLKVLIGNNVQNGEDVLWEPTNTAKFMNTNSGIIGTMGTGKTQCTKSVITQLYRNQHNNVDGKPIGVLIFDYKSDYVDDKFLDATNGKKFKLFKLPYNPLSLFGDTPMLPIHTAAGFSETMAKAYGLGKKQQLKLENIILEAYELAGIKPENPSTWNRPAPTIENIWDLFLEQEKVEEDSLYAALSKLARFKIFETEPEKMMSLYELVDGVTVIELAGYPGEVQNLIVALTLDLFYSQMQKQGKPEVQGDFRQVSKLILVDEADNFMSQNFTSLRRILKEGREYGVGVILSTQDITHFKTSDNDYSAYILSWIVHRVSQIKNQDIKSIFNKDEKTDQDQLMKSIRELEKHFSLYVNGDKKITKIKDKAFWEL